MLLFAEKAALRFSIKELAGVIDRITSVLMVHDVESELKPDLPHVNGARQYKQQKPRNKSNRQLGRSNLELLEEIRSGSLNIETKFKEIIMYHGLESKHPSTTKSILLAKENKQL